MCAGGNRTSAPDVEIAVTLGVVSRAGFAAAALVLLVGCGAVPATTDAPATSDVPITSDGLATTDASSTTEAPPTTQSLPTDDAIACPHFRSPTSAQVEEQLAADATVFAERNLGAINAYVSAHADQGGTPWLDWVTEPPRLVIGFTSNVAEHRSDLVPLLSDPDRVFVCKVAHSQAEVSRIAAQIQQAQTSSAGGFLSVSPGVDGVTVQLRADSESVAEDLVARYGDIVSIMLGNLPYPASTGATSDATGTCTADVTGPTDLNGLRADLVFADPTVHSGQDIDGTVTVTNTGNAPATFQSGSPLVGWVVLPGTTSVVASYTGAIAGVGVGGTLAPGESSEIAVLVGTASCEPGLGYTLPPGQYQVLVPVVVLYPQRAGDPTINQLVTRPAALTVVP